MNVVIQYLLSVSAVYALILMIRKTFSMLMPSIAKQQYLSILISALTIVAVMQFALSPLLISYNKDLTMKDMNNNISPKIKRVVLAHAWPADAETAWYPSLKASLEKMDIEMVIPTLPSPEESTAQDWVKTLKEAAADKPSETLLIGHSIGGTALLRMLQSTDQQFAGLVMVSTAGFDLGYPALKDFFEGEFNYEKIKQNTGFVTTFYSPNDQVLAPDPVLHAKTFLTNLDAKTILLHNRGHFAPFDNCTDIPELLEEIEIRK